MENAYMKIANTSITHNHATIYFAKYLHCNGSVSSCIINLLNIQ